MPGSSLTPDNLPGGSDRTLGRGHSTRELGPSDSSDSGSDMGNLPLEGDSDRAGTGERASTELDEAEVDGTDIDVDQVLPMPEQDDRLDEAEEAQVRPVYGDKGRKPSR